MFGSTGTDDDKHMGLAESKAFVSDPSLVVEEKIDGTNVGIHDPSFRREVNSYVGAINFFLHDQ